MFDVDYSKVYAQLAVLGISDEDAYRIVTAAEAAGNPAGSPAWHPLIFESRPLLALRGVGPKGVRRFADFIREGKWGYVLY